MRMIATVSGGAMALALAGCAAVSTPAIPGAGGTEAGRYRAVLTVNDTDGVGKVGDAYLSLAEAILLANGGLAIDALSAAERAQISGNPGRTSADRIVLAAGARIAMPVQPPVLPNRAYIPDPNLKLYSSIPPIEGNDGDMIEGNHAIITNGSDPDGPVSGLGLVVGSSDFTLRDVIIRRMAKPFEMRPATADGLKNVIISGSTFEDGGPSITATAADGSAAIVTGVQFLDNRILGPGATGRKNEMNFNQALGLTAAATPSPGAIGSPAPETSLNQVIVRGNEIRGFGSGVSIVAASSSRGRMANAHIRDLLFDRNVVEIDPDAGDPALMMWGAALLGGDVRDSGMSNIRFTDNIFVAPGMPVYLTSVEVVFSNASSDHAEGIVIDGLTFTGNTLRSQDPKRCGRAAQISSVFIEFGLGTAKANVMRNATFSGNRVEGCREGLFFSSADNHAAPGRAVDNVLEKLKIENNIIDAQEHGIMLAGGTIEKGPLAGAAPGGRAENNRIRDVLVSRNEIRVPQGTGVSIFGGYVRGARNVTVTGNSASAVHGGDNRIDARIACEFLDQQILDGGNGAERNSVADVTLPCVRGALPVAFVETRPKAFNTTTSTIGDLLGNPAAKAILTRNLPGLADGEQISLAAGMTLRQLQAHVPTITEEKLRAIDIELAALAK